MFKKELIPRKEWLDDLNREFFMNALVLFSIHPIFFFEIIFLLT